MEEKTVTLDTRDQDDSSPLVGIGGCLTGQAVRLNGQARRVSNPVSGLADLFTYKPFCPEVGIGLGVPREPLRLVGDADNPRVVDSATHEKDCTDNLAEYAALVLNSSPTMCAYILVKGSPSCGFSRVKRYNLFGNVAAHDGQGAFARALQQLDPLLPMEDDGRLHDHGLRENFVCRALVYHNWKNLKSAGLGAASLLSFYTSLKYLLMAHQPSSYQMIGRLMASAGTTDTDRLGEELIRQVMKTLEKPASRGGRTNALLHISGYLKKCLSSRERNELRDTLLEYQQGSIPLIVPMTMLRHHFGNHPNPYIHQQFLMNAYPNRLQLGNAI